MTNNKSLSTSQYGLFRRTWLYLFRALRWRCPICGISPMFLPPHRIESITDWVDTLPGCPRCDYYYHREPGYFLLALWVINFGIVSVIGVIEVLVLGIMFKLSTPLLIFITLVTMWGAGLLTVRHTKSLFLAFDHFVHPLDEDRS